jgi:DNA repair protein RecN (Recombination protein N)
MLVQLSIRNFAIIEDLTIRFDSGLTILSGETGAGKSIIINAVNLLLGSRASAGLIRTGAQNAELEALFDVPPDSPLSGMLEDSGFDSDEGLMVRRIISKNDRHRIYINGRLSTMQVLTGLTAHLASISGQHAHQGLLKEESHLDILDQFGDLMPLRSEYASIYRTIQPMLAREQELLRRQAHQAEQLELLRFQHQEIVSAAITSGEDEALEQERRRLKNGEMLFQQVRQCVEGLYSADGAVVEIFGQTNKALEKAAGIDPELLQSASELAELTYKTEAVAFTLRDYLGRIDLDPGRLEDVDARLDQLNKLKRKYGGSLEIIIRHKENIECQLQETENIGEAIEQVRAELQDQHNRLSQLSLDLSSGRRRSARRLSRLVEAELASLKMADTRFVVDVQPLPVTRETNPYLCFQDHALGETGSDRAAFMLAPNVGEKIKPLAAIASGGELSRVVLALKAILARTESVETVVFDEVDAGIGGGVAEMVGKKLEALARHHQILCITHLPQIARYGHHQYRIQKSVSKGRTRTTIIPLDSKARIEEIARMLGGEKITATTREHAREMLNNFN